jgi:hypothetical protein
MYIFAFFQAKEAQDDFTDVILFLFFLRLILLLYLQATVSSRSAKLRILSAPPRVSVTAQADTTIQPPTSETDDHEVEIALSSLPITLETSRGQRQFIGVLL